VLYLKDYPIDSDRLVYRIERVLFDIFAQSRSKGTMGKAKKIIYTLMEKWNMNDLLDSAEGQYRIFFIAAIRTKRLLRIT
jgi:hypothetical protein